MRLIASHQLTVQKCMQAGGRVNSLSHYFCKLYLVNFLNENSQLYRCIDVQNVYLKTKHLRSYLVPPYLLMFQTALEPTLN